MRTGLFRKRARAKSLRAISSEASEERQRETFFKYTISRKLLGIL